MQISLWNVALQTINFLVLVVLLQRFLYRPIMAVNPLGLQGQIEGGVMMGLGNCLTEEFIVENGNVVTDHLARYRVPGIMLTPEITSIVVEHPIEAGPYGAKGVGEVCSIPTTPAITNAIYNAVGVRIDRTPVDQELIANEIWERENK